MTSKDRRKDNKEIEENPNLDKEALRKERPIEEVEENIREDLGLEEEADNFRPPHEIVNEERDRIIRDSGLDPNQGM